MICGNITLRLRIANSVLFIRLLHACRNVILVVLCFTAGAVIFLVGFCTIHRKTDSGQSYIQYYKLMNILLRLAKLSPICKHRVSEI